MDAVARMSRTVTPLLEPLEQGRMVDRPRLARNVDAYKANLAACDQPRVTRDLAEYAILPFTCTDQLTFMERLMQP